ncbi:SagB/ThcOx family dehydrogenase [Streptomyces bikiniensis]|uniref:SagB/ThcOx family dehydrogenase n=1 Tax=Streptomyces bikiniensis TaxID=1896 RepID=A0ABW8CQE8_STRBI
MERLHADRPAGGEHPTGGKRPHEGLPADGERPRADAARSTDRPPGAGHSDDRRPGTGIPDGRHPGTSHPDGRHPGTGLPGAGHPGGLAAALALARSSRVPGTDTSAGTAVPVRSGPPLPVPAPGPAELDLEALLRLSLAASDASGRLRPAASAGALHPVDTELVVGAGCSLPPGRYGYDPLRHRVHRLGPPPDGTSPGATAELSVTARRTASHYGHRALPLLLLDTGHAAAALLLAARASGAGEAEPVLDGATEHPLAAVRVTPPGPVRSSPSRQPAYVPAPEELVTRRSDPPPLPGTPPPDALRAVLAAAAAAGGDDLRWCVAVGPPEPGLLEVVPGGAALRRCAAGEARPTLAAWAAGQAWIAEVGAVLLARGCPEDADAPHLRRAHLRAGFAVHLAHLTARRHGLAARPVGSWQRADLGAALGAAPGRDWIVHALALGTRRAGPAAPGAAPHRVTVAVTRHAPRSPSGTGGAPAARGRAPDSAPRSGPADKAPPDTRRTDEENTP